MEAIWTAGRFSRRSLFAGGFALMAAGCSMPEAQILRAADTQPDGYPTVTALRFLAERLNELSDGRLRLKVFPGGQLGEEKDTLEVTIFGGLDFNRVNMAPLNAFAPETIIPNLPFIFRSTQHMREAMDGLPGHTILESLRPHGLIGLCFYDSGDRNFYTTKRPIETLDDLAGLKIRVQNSDLYVAMVEALGANATPMAFGEVYQGLLQGVVDGAENNWPSYESTRHFEAAKFYSLTRHVMAPEVLTMSVKRWEKLSEQDQFLIRQCAEESVAVMREHWDARTARARENVLAAGVKVSEPDLTPFRDRVRPVWQKYINTPELKALADSIEEAGDK